MSQSPKPPKPPKPPGQPRGAVEVSDCAAARLEADAPDVRGFSEVVCPCPPEPLLTSVVLLCVLMACALPRVCGRGNAEVSPPATVAAINPNRAPWWELTALPEVGEHTACSIVQYRNLIESAPSEDQRLPVFQSANDLAKVRGIGPKTVQRIAPHVFFEPWRELRFSAARACPRHPR